MDFNGKLTRNYLYGIVLEMLMSILFTVKANVPEDIHAFAPLKNDTQDDFSVNHLPLVP